MSNLMGRQIRLECLKVESRFINGQIIMECIGADGAALPYFYIKVIHRFIHRLWTVKNAVGRVGKSDPCVLSLTPTTYILPQKKFVLK